MKLNNPFQMNDWEIMRFLKVIFSIQLALWVVIGLDYTGLQIPILRELISFIYLTFVPGILILRILKLHNLGNIETILYSVGLSIATLMFTGFFMNMLYPLFGISGPISLVPLVITICVVVLVLCILSYTRDKDFSDPGTIDVEDILSPSVLILCLIPFMAIFGTYLVNFHQNNILLMLLIVVLAIISLLIGFDKFIPMKLYPMAIFVIAISVLYHASLITMYIWGRDIHKELYFSNLVMWNSYWDPTVPSVINAMLSVIMLSPIFSITCDLDFTWVFKIIYPFLFSLVPIGLYRIFQKQTNDKIAFLSCFYFISSHIFFGDMLQVARQEIAELFLILIILAMIDKNMDKMKRSFISIIFCISMAVSHYGLSYIYMISLISAWLILVLGENPEIQKLKYNLFSRFNIKMDHLAENRNPFKEDKTISPLFVLIYVIFALAWYMYVSSSTTFNKIVSIGGHITGSISEIFNPDQVEALSIATRAFPPTQNVLRFMYFITQFFIAAGILTLLLKRSETKFEREYSAFSIMFFMILLASLVLPNTSTTIGTGRAYHIGIILLAPFCVIGSVSVFRIVGKVVRVPWNDQHVKNSLKISSVFFAIFLIFSTGLVSEIAKDDPTSISLNATITHPRFHFNTEEVYGARWLVNAAETESDIYAGDFGRFIVWHFVNDIKKVRLFNNETNRVSQGSYIFMGSLNVRDDEVVVRNRTAVAHLREYPKLSKSRFYNEIVIHANKIYENGGANVYISKEN